MATCSRPFVRAWLDNKFSNQDNEIDDEIYAFHTFRFVI